MKDLMQQAKSLLLFDFPIQPDYIRTTFATTHLNYQQVFPHWCPGATRKKLIAAFWYRQVLSHFALMISLAFVLVFLMGGMVNISLLPMFTISLPAFTILFFVPICHFTIAIFFPYWIW